MPELSLPSISASGWSKPIGNYTPVMRRAVLALAAFGGATFLPSRGGWLAGEIIIEDVTMRALKARDDVRYITNRGSRRIATLTQRGQATAEAIRRKQAEAA